MKKRQRYSKEFKLDAVRLVTEQGYSIAEGCPQPGPKCQYARPLEDGSYRIGKRLPRQR